MFWQRKRRPPPFRRLANLPPLDITWAKPCIGMCAWRRDQVTQWYIYLSHSTLVIDPLSCTLMICTALHCMNFTATTMHWTMLHCYTLHYSVCTAMCCSVLLISTSVSSPGWNQGAVLCSREGSSPEEALYWPLLHQETGRWCRAAGLEGGSVTQQWEVPQSFIHTLSCLASEKQILYVLCTKITYLLCNNCSEKNTAQIYQPIFIQTFAM